MTEKEFWNDPYLTELTSQVTRIEGNDVELSHTIIYAESGGQESDVATIAGIPVVVAMKDEKRIIYTLQSPPNFAVGDNVVSQIDWNRRYALMKLHFAAEVVLELFTQRYPEIAKIGAHISQDKSRINFEWHENINPLLVGFTQQAQAIIDADLPIISAFSDQEQQRRYWRVEGFAQVPCGGTHLKRTSEVGKIALKRKNIGKGKERVEITLVVSE